MSKGDRTMSKEKKERGAWLDAYMKLRKEWEINPTTQVINSKKVYTRKEKHKGANYYEDWTEQIP